ADYNTAQWSSGTIRFANGTAYAINSGDTGNITLTTYIYLDTKISSTVLQTSTTYTDSIGDAKILLAIVLPAADTGSKCVINALGSAGTTIDGNKITTGKIQSSDGKTYFDLDNDKFVVNDTNDRLLLGSDA